MTSVFGNDRPTIGYVSDWDSGPLQIAAIFTSPTPFVVSHARFYVATTTLAAEIGGTMNYQVWREGEPSSAVTGTFTIPAAVGWVEDELSTYITVPGDRHLGVAISFPATTPISYGQTDGVLPITEGVLTCVGANYYYEATTIPSTHPTFYEPYRTNYLIDLEAIVSEFVAADPPSLIAGDVIEHRTHTRGTVVTNTPDTDAVILTVTVEGGPLDGTDIDLWVPDTAEGLASADMSIYQEVDDPPIPSLHFNTADDSYWSYVGGGQYICVTAGSVYSLGAYTTRVATPTLEAYFDRAD